MSNVNEFFIFLSVGFGRTLCQGRSAGLCVPGKYSASSIPDKLFAWISVGSVSLCSAAGGMVAAVCPLGRLQLFLISPQLVNCMQYFHLCCVTL